MATAATHRQPRAPSLREAVPVQLQLIDLLGEASTSPTNGREIRVAGGRPAIVEAEPEGLADSELAARLFRALGDATRLRLLEVLLQEGELHQMELVRRVGATQAGVVTIGGGFVGMEQSQLLARLGSHVTVVGPRW